jgi:uncharacterized protein
MTERPIPSPDPATAPYWDGARRGRLRLPRCTDCGKAHFYPRTICPHCRSASLDWIDARGTGTVYSYTVVQRAPSPAFAADVPYAVAIVALDEGPHLMASIVDAAPDSIRIGMAVQVRFRELDDTTRLPVFGPVTP